MLSLSSCKNNEIEKTTPVKKPNDLEKYKNSKVVPATYYDKYTDEFNNTKIDSGSYVGVYKDSTVAFTGNFINGKQEGLFHFYYPNGALRFTDMHSNGLDDGYFAYYDSLGTITESGQYAKGKKVGYWYTWWDYKTLRSKAKHVDDIEVEYFYYHENGNLDSKSYYKDEVSDGNYVSYYDNGKLETEGKYQQGYQIGTWKYFHPNGEIKRVEHYIEQINSGVKNTIDKYKNTRISIYFPIKTWTTFDSAGNILSKTFHDNNYKVQKVEKFNSSGNLVSMTEYNGQTFYACSRNPGHKIKNGKEIEYFVNGKIKILGKNKNNLKNGEWLYYDSLGTLMKRVEYLNDSLITQ